MHIAKHIKNIFETGELIEKATVSKMETVQKEDGSMDQMVALVTHMLRK
jgi:hypothetical protein